MIKSIFFLFLLTSSLFSVENNQPSVKEKEGVIEIYAETPSGLKDKFDDNGSWYYSNYYQTNNLHRFQLQEALKKAAEESLKKGFQYFAIVNREVNNLQGFPINNYEDLKNYCFVFQGNKNFGTNFSNGGKMAARYRGIFRNNGIFLKIIPMNETPGIFLWNSKKTLEDLI